MGKNSYVQVCEHCGSTKVARLQWVNVNSDRKIEGSPDPGIYTEWCFGKCKEKTTIIEKDEYKKDKTRT
jgi:hypothetical protein